jgi:drug/metabolite transporter (DMT)-like permease
MIKNNALLSALLIILAAVLWSGDGLLRTTLFSLPPAIVVFWEHILGAILLAPFILRSLPEFKKLSKKDWIAISLVSLFSGALGTIFYTAALAKVNFIQFSVVVLLQQLQPIWAIAMAHILLKEKLSRNFMVWAGLAIAASYVVSFKDLTINLTTGQGTIIAAILALLAGVMWGSSTSFSKIVLEKTSFVTTTFLRFLLAPLFALTIAMALRQQGSIVAISLAQWQSLFLITLSTGMVALLIYYKGLKGTPVKVSSILELAWPASAIAIDYFYFHRSLSYTQVIGVCILIFSIYKVTQLQNEQEMA